MEYRGFLDREYFSRYSKNRVINSDNKLYFEHESSIDVSSLNFMYHTVTSRDEGKLTVIAQRYYGNPLYWWMIALINGFIDPFDVPEKGTQIKIPYKNEIIQLFNKVVN